MQAGDLQSLRHAPYPALLWDVARRRVIWANAAAVAWFGAHALAELVERPFDEREPGVRALSNAAEELRQGAGSEEPLQLKLRFPSTGQDTPLEARVRLCPLADGREALLLVGAEHANAARPRVLSEILGEMPQPILALTSAGEPLFINAAAMELLGEQGLVGEQGLFPGENALRAFLLRAREAGTAVETRQAHTRAGMRTLRLTARAAAQDDLIVVMVDDITDRLRAERGELPELRATADITATPARADEEHPPRDETADATAESPRLRADELAALRRMMQALQEEDIPELAPTAEPSDVSAASSQEAPAPAKRDEASDNASPAREEESAAAAEDVAEDARPKRSRISIRVKKTAPPEEGSAGAEASGLSRQPPETMAPPKTAAGKEGALATDTSREAPNTNDVSTTETSSPDREEEASAEGGTAVDAPSEPAAPGHLQHLEAASDAGIASRSGEEPAAPGQVFPFGHGEEAQDDASAKQPAQHRERPEPPQLVRDVLDHRPEPIILHRADSFYFANRAAREMFGHADNDAAWDDMARALANSHDGMEITLPTSGGGRRRFSLKRDVFPWRAGVVVQSTLLPLDQTAEDGQTPAPKADATDSPGRGASLSVPPQGAAPALSTSRAARRAPAPVIRIHTEHGGRPAGSETGNGSTNAALAEQPIRSQAAERAPVMDEELRTMLETAADGIITLNAQGEILSFSSGAERLFGHAAPRVLGRPFRELLAEESRPALDVRLARLQKDGAAAGRRDEGREVLGLAASGKAVPLYLTIGVLQHDQPREVEHRASYCVVVHDISAFKQRERELKQAKEQAEQRSARKSEFLARISHELRTPLNAILGFSDVLRQELFGRLGNEKYRDYARDIYESGEHLLSLVNDLLDLARIEAGRYELDLKEVDLARIVEESANIMREQVGHAGMTLRRIVPENLPRVVADARALKQILLNLLSNAVKYGREGDTIVIRLRTRNDGGLELSVKDSGPGMSEEELRDAMEPFRRVPRTGEGKPGTGLGLPLAKALAEANRARFEIESQPGKGTEARIIFPPHRVLA